MRSTLWKRIGMVFAVIAVIGGGYFAWMMLPGGVLSGTATSVPADWTGIEVPDVVRLESNPAEPYSVKIWIVPLGEELYVHAGANRSAWVEYIEQDSAVRVLMDDRLYDLQAARVTEADEFARFAEAYESRYGVRPRNENVNEVYLFRLSARP